MDCPKPKVCEPCEKCPRCKVCQEDRRQKIMDAAAFDDEEEEDDCPQVPNLTSSLRQNPCFPFQYVMTTFDAGGIGNKMSEYATLVAVTSMTGYTPGLSEVNEHSHGSLFCWSVFSQVLYDELSAAFPNLAHQVVNLTDECKDLRKYVDTSKIAHFDSFLQFGVRKFTHIRLVNYPNAVRLYDKMYGIIKHLFTFQPE